MAKADTFSLLYFLLLSVLLYIVYMGGRPQEHAFAANKHYTMLHKSLGSASSAKDSLVYSYWRSFNGFAARLTEVEAARISEMEGVISVKPSRKYKLHTTRSWDFMNLTVNQLGPSTNSDVIIGFLDSGVWPEHPSFNDKGFGPPPAKWNGTCTTHNFTCNNKIIGARYYNSYDLYLLGEMPSPRDTDGHGTHTASTASGVQVDSANFFGLGQGKARGISGSRIAVYKVCWAGIGCDSASILKAFDDAIADGVDIISVSLGSDEQFDYSDDPIAIGSFHAMRNGILTSGSAGNDGPKLKTVTNSAPWMLTVGASSIDRKFVARVELGNGQYFYGIAINVFDDNGTTYPLIWGGDVANYTSGYYPRNSRKCIAGTMNADQVYGKIVYCESMDFSGVMYANGAGIIMTDMSSAYRDIAFSWPLPTTVVDTRDGDRVLEYIRVTNKPEATIFYSDEWKDPMAPIVASFSSRGPSLISPDILKPDVTAPGLDILAGWSPFGYDVDDQSSMLFNIVSGTSMSCPHASGAAAYVKAVHPDWSPAAIKSALMTTASVMDRKKHEDLELAYGSGHIEPVAALDPGLVFNASEADYIDFLCGHGYNTTTLRRITGDNSTCAGTRGRDLNYPSFSLYVQDGQTIKKTFTGKVTNVCARNSTYTASWHVPASSISVTVEPSILTFSDYRDNKTFTVSVSGPAIWQQPIMSGAIMWTDGAHVGAPNNLGVAQSMRVPARQKSLIYQKIEKKGKQVKSCG
ncbi:subtilase family protein [Striga asiatica]|uniref:Subtilase family protein n=1 Tax=Striga asiatica TaxID=4170 RepID=A0A5A7Q630_STRAF|nr:subtilase family protein [Striga asiatica]